MLWDIKKRDKRTIRYLVKEVIEDALGEPVDVEPEPPKSKEYGDISSNAPLKLARKLKESPDKIGRKILERLSGRDEFEVEYVSGFLNFRLSDKFILTKLRDYSLLPLETFQGLRILVEFVSANPTGPLHVGHGRIAAVGDSIARILSLCSAQVLKEFYINDVGEQIRSLGRSVVAYKKGTDELEYKGDYIEKVAKMVSADEPDKVGEQASERILDWIKRDLEDFGVIFENFVSEKEIHRSGYVEEAINMLVKGGYIENRESAVYFLSSFFGDEKDRVIIRSSGVPTYFAGDIGYHLNKVRRGFDILVNVWGADHHGYITRVKAALSAMGINPEILKVVLVQMVNLMRGGKPVSMSKREGTYVTLSELISEVGSDSARFIYLSRSPSAHLDFDIELAKKKTMENPVFYVQYVHARICSLFKEASARGLEHTSDQIQCFKTKKERDIAVKVVMFRDEVEQSALSCEPHRIVSYLMNLASEFHSFYQSERILVDDKEVRKSRLTLCEYVRRVIRKGLWALGVSTPESM